MRLDVEESSVDSIYITVWASSLLPLHMGRTENASKMIEEHFGRQLQVIFAPSSFISTFELILISVYDV